MPRRKTPVATEGIKEGKKLVQPVDDVLRANYMPYAMSVIVSRALPSIDGFKPAHRKLLYSMYKMGLLSGARTKCANIVGQTMRLNPHGDQAIYETLVRLTRGNGALLMPFIDSKGNFGKAYSRDMAYAAYRYTEAKLDPVCAEILSEINRNAVDMEDNYDGTMKEPVLLPTAFPNILVSANTGIAVGMASSFPGFCFSEVCRAAAEYARSPKKADIAALMPAPDFSTGGVILVDKDEMANIYETGKGSFRIRAVWSFLKRENLIEVTEIPYSTSIEVIVEKIAELMKAGKVQGIADVRDESDKSGLKLVIDLRRGADPNAVMDYLMRNTPLVDSFACNFNLLIDGQPRVLGVKAILDEWLKWRIQTKERTLRFELDQLTARLHLLRGLEKILLDINKAVRIIQKTEDDAEVVPALMKGFKIDEAQAEFVAEIKLRNINRGYILKQTAVINDIEKRIAEIKRLLGSNSGLRSLIAHELLMLERKYHKERMSRIEYVQTGERDASEPVVSNDPVVVLLSADGYMKKLTPEDAEKQQKWRPGDKTATVIKINEQEELVFLSRSALAYKRRACDIPTGSAGGFGEFAASVAEMGPGEQLLSVFAPGSAFDGFLAVGYENGKVSVSEVSGFETKQNRHCLKNAYGSVSAPVGAVYRKTRSGYLYLETSKGRKVAVPTKKIPVQGRGSRGVQVLALRKGETMTLLREATAEEAQAYLPKRKSG